MDLMFLQGLGNEQRVSKEINEIVIFVVIICYEGNKWGCVRKNKQGGVGVYVNIEIRGDNF